MKTAVSAAETALARVEENAQDLQKKYVSASEAAEKVKTLKDFGRIKEEAETFQSALATGRALAAEYPDPLGSIQKGIEGLSSGHTKQSLLALLDKTKREVGIVSKEIQVGEHALEKLRGNIESWFNDAMDRFTGWYKRWTRQISFAIAVIVVAVANADTMMLANRFARDGALRAAIVAAADGATQKMAGVAGDFSKVQDARQQLLAESEKLNLPLGWIDPKVNGIEDPFEFERIPNSAGGWALKAFGLLLSALAVSLGAPFWFDTLSKFMNVRGAGKVPPATRIPQSTGVK